jgi:hypothetical protein
VVYLFRSPLKIKMRTIRESRGNWKPTQRAKVKIRIAGPEEVQCILKTMIISGILSDNVTIQFFGRA